MRNFLLSSSVFLFSASIALGDNFLQRYLPGVTQGQAIILFILVSFFNYKLIINNRFLILSVLIASVTSLFFSLGGFKNMVLLYTILGSVFLGIATFNPRLQNEIIRYSFISFPIMSLFVSLTYYLRLWTLNELTGRSSFLDNNENILAGLLVFGYCIILYKFIKFTTFSGKAKYLFFALIHLPPIIATGSRSGFLILAVASLCAIFAKISLKFRKAFIGTAVLIAFVVASIGISIQDSNSVINRFKNLSEDDRFAIWSLANNLVVNNMFTGGGFGNFNDADWRIANDLFVTRPGVKPNSIQLIAVSLHNSFLDLILIGGIWLLIPYLLIILNLFVRSFRYLFSRDIDLQVIGAFILPVVTGIFIFSFGGQGATDKSTWFQFGICYLLIWQANKVAKLKRNRMLNENRV